MKTLFFALGVVSLVGCNTTFRPIGPLAKETPLVQQGKPLPSAPPDATPPPAVRPTPPTMLVTPSDVSADNPYDAANRLTTELSTDSKATLNAPVTAEISRIKGRGK